MRLLGRHPALTVTAGEAADTVTLVAVARFAELRLYSEMKLLVGS